MPPIGTTRRLDAEFEAGGVDTNPTTITLTITAPNGTITTPSPTHDATGKYHHDLLLDQRGVWTATWAGTGAVPITGTQTITVSGGSGEGPYDNWITWGELANYVTPPTGLTALMQDAVLASATRLLWERSCRQFGTCTIERSRVRPLCRHRYQWGGRFGWYLRPGYATCACGLGHFIPMGDEPVLSVQGVWESGVAVPAADYRVDDWNRLVRTDGQPWTNSASLDADQGDPGTLEVAWTYGLPVPEDAKMACALLAAKTATQALEDCGISSNATQINREGVTITISPPKGDTGIVLVERWLGNFHCGGGAIFDPGQQPLFARTSTSPVA